MQARENWSRITALRERGEDATDLILDGLLPHRNTAHNRERGAWVHVAPTVTKDVKKWFVNTGWAKTDDWPDVANSIFAFVETSMKGPEYLKSACDTFGASPYSTGIQSAFLSPILNALRPEDYLIFNTKSRRTLRLITDERHRPHIEAYPVANASLRRLLEQVNPLLAKLESDASLQCDVFDEFCHWLIAVKRFPLPWQRNKTHVKRTIDRYDPTSAARVFLDLLPNDVVREACLKFFADSIEAANALGSFCWNTALFSKRINLSVGRMLSFQIKRGLVRVGVAVRELDSGTSKKVDAYATARSAFTTSEPTELIALPADSFVELRSALEPAFREFLRIAYRTGKKTPFASSHSPAVVNHLQAELGLSLPQPGYAAEPGAPTAMPAATKVNFPTKSFTTSDYSVTGLLNYVDNRDVGLPDIQRPFVWSATRVRDLFDSMYRGFPVGYLLFWENADVRGTRTIGIGSKKEKVPHLLVVDGQQRLTSLYAVMRGKPVLDSDFREVNLEIAFRPRDARFDVSDAAIKQDPEFISNISSLWTSGKSSYFIVNDYFAKLEAKRSLTHEDREAISHNLDRLLNLIEYPFTALQIASQVDEQAVADIFVRINSEGVKLRQADFILTLLSVFWDEGRADLERFARRSKKPPAAGEPSPFNYLIQPTPSQLLRAAIAVGFHRGRLRNVYQVLRGKDIDTGQFSPELRAKQFATLERAQQAVLDLKHWHLFLGCINTVGYRASHMISSRAALIYTYALYLIGKLQCGVEERSLQRLIGRWFFMVSLTGRYTGSSETAIEADLGRVRALSSPDPFVDALEKIIDSTLTSDFWEITVPTDLETSSTRTPAWLAYVVAQIRRGAPVLFSDKRLSEAMDPSLRATRKTLEAHHVFPKAWLQRNGITTRRHTNQVANLAHLEWPDNARIGATRPAEYVPELKSQFSDAAWENMCRHHALPAAWESMEYNKFLEERRLAMAQVIRLGFEALSGASEFGDELLDVSSGTKEEQAAWRAIESLERELRSLIRKKYQGKWNNSADAKIEKTLGSQAWTIIERNQAKYAKQYRTSQVADELDVLDFCYLGQLAQLIMANDAWEMFRDAFRDKRELDDLVRAIVPVRNDKAHFRPVPKKELQRCRIAIDDLKQLLSRLPGRETSAHSLD